MGTQTECANALTSLTEQKEKKNKTQHTKPSKPSSSATWQATAYLVGAVEQGENISFFHSHLPRTLLLVIIECQHKLFSSFIIGGSNLLLTGKATEEK